MHHVMQERGPDKHLSARGFDAVFGVHLRIVANGQHIRLRARIEKADRVGGAVAAPRRCVVPFGHADVVGAGKPRMGMVVQVVVIAKAVHVGPGLNREVDRVIDAGALGVIDHRAFDTGLQPAEGGMRMGEQIAREVVRRHLRPLPVHLFDKLRKDRVGLLGAGQVIST